MSGLADIAAFPSVMSWCAIQRANLMASHSPAHPLKQLRFQNDRLPRGGSHAHTHEHLRSLDDLRPGLGDEIEDVFRHYNEMKGTELLAPVRIRINLPTWIILAQVLPEPHATVERMGANCWITNTVKPLPPQAVANGQALQCW